MNGEVHGGCKGIEAPAGDAFRRAWLEPPRPLRSLRGLKAHADPLGVAPASASIPT